MSVPKICLVCSSRGHLFAMNLLKEAWEPYERVWVTPGSEDAMHFLEGEYIYKPYSPTDRNLRNLLRNFFLALQILRKEKPSMLISTGAGVGVPFIYAAKLLGIRTVFIEAWTRVESLSMTGKLVYPVVDHLYVQYPELAEKYKKAHYKGQYV